MRRSTSDKAELCDTERTNTGTKKMSNIMCIYTDQCMRVVIRHYTEPASMDICYCPGSVYESMRHCAERFEVTIRYHAENPEWNISHYADQGLATIRHYADRGTDTVRHYAD